MTSDVMPFFIYATITFYSMKDKSILTSTVRMVFFLSILASFVALAHTIIYMAAETAWPLSLAFPSGFLQIFLATFAFASVAVLFISSRYNNSLTRFLYRMTAVWMGFFVYLFLGAFAYGAILGILEPPGAGLWLAPLSWLGQLLGAVALLAGIYGLLHARSLKTKRIPLALPDLPAFWKGKRIVFVSDIHLGQVHGAAFARRMVEAVNAAKPDIVFIGGDLYDGVKVDEKAIIAPLAGLKPPQGIYFVTGNHEEFSDSTHFLTAIRSLGIRVLLNEMADIEGLQVLGVTDHDSIYRNRLAGILADLKIDRSRPSILLKHQPSHLEIPERAGVSMQISGHTHRAQQFPLNILPYLIYKGHSYGLTRYKEMLSYTSSGVGTWGPPMRVGSDSEIVVFELS